MMQPLIFTEQRWLPRAIDIALTCLAWAGFLWLIYFGIARALAHKPDVGPGPFYSTLMTLLGYVAALLFNGLALIVWARYNQYRFRVERRKRRPELSQDELAASFALKREVADAMKSARVQTVYHDGSGSIDSTQITVSSQPVLLPAPKPTLQLPLRLIPQPGMVRRRVVAAP